MRRLWTALRILRQLNWARSAGRTDLLPSLEGQLSALDARHGFAPRLAPADMVTENRSHRTEVLRRARARRAAGAQNHE
jgi:hypothetical protein